MQLSNVKRLNQAMKIYPGTYPKPQIVTHKKPETTGVSKSPCSFQKILQEEQKTMTPHSVDSPNTIGQFPGTTTTKAQEQTISYVNDTLELIGHLGKLLEPQDQLQEKRLPHVRNVLQERIKGLITLRNGLSANDPLKDTVTDLGVRMAVEAYKIARGDYSEG